MKFNIVTKEIKSRELIEYEESPSFAKLNRLMSRFMVDETTGERVPTAQALDILGDLNVEENQEVQVAFMESFVPNQMSARR